MPQTRNLFTITYRDLSPRLAHDVVQSLLTIFVESATGGNRTNMENARRFLEHQISSYEQQLRAAEKRRADFRLKYIDIFPTDINPSTFGVEQAKAAVKTLQGQLQDATEKRDALKKEVEQTPPLLEVENISAATAQAAGQTQLAQAQQQLHDMLLVNTDQHPDVIALKRVIAQLKANPEKANQPVTPAAPRQPDVKRSVPNPVFDNLKVRLVDAGSALQSLQRQLGRFHPGHGSAGKFQQEQPGLLAEFQNMDRDYGVLRKNYDELLGRLQSANIAQAADTQADKVKLQIVDPPEIPRIAVAPNRVLLLSGVLVAGIGAGAVIVLLLSQMDRSFNTVDNLRSLGLPGPGRDLHHPNPLDIRTPDDLYALCDGSRCAGADLRRTGASRPARLGLTRMFGRKRAHLVERAVERLAQVGELDGSAVHLLQPERQAGPVYTNSPAVLPHNPADFRHVPTVPAVAVGAHSLEVLALADPDRHDAPRGRDAQGLDAQGRDAQGRDALGQRRDARRDDTVRDDAEAIGLTELEPVTAAALAPTGPPLRTADVGARPEGPVEEHGPHSLIPREEGVGEPVRRYDLAVSCRHDRLEPRAQPGVRGIPPGAAADCAHRFHGCGRRAGLFQSADGHQLDPRRGQKLHRPQPGRLHRAPA